MNPTATVLRVASVSKAFTATAVMQLVEQGKLDLDRDVNEYLDFAIPAAFGQPVTVRHLLTHTAGFEEIAYKRYSPPQTLREHVLRVPDRIYPPGAIPAYSNYGLALAGYIVARVSGESIADYVDRHILAPLGMEHSSFRMTLPATLESALAKSYALASGEPYSPDLVAALTPDEAPASALATTGEDMTRFLLAHLGDGRYGEYQLLRPETVRLMQGPSLVPIPGAQPIGLGLWRSDYRGHQVVGHSGDGEGQHAELKLMPDQKVGFFLVVNSDGVVASFLPAAFNVRIALFEQFVDRYFPAPAPADEPTAPTAQAHAKIVAGEYMWSRQQVGDFQEAIGLIGRFAFKPVIRANDDGTIETPAYLTFEKDGRSQTWREIGPFVYREVGGNARLVMNVVDGRVQSLWTDQSPSFWVDLPVPALKSAMVNVPLLLVSIALLVVTVLAWPIVALVRRRRAAEKLPEPEHRAGRLTRWAALLGVLYILGWFLALAKDAAGTVGSEPWIRLLQAIGLLGVVGAGISVWNAWVTWRGSRGVSAKLWSLAPAFALVFIAWFSFAFHLISTRIN
jgi:CubicO group peptidase (beta-lactamase class C family)